MYQLALRRFSGGPGRLRSGSEAEDSQEMLTARMFRDALQ